MSNHILTREQLVSCPLDRTFAFFAEARNLQAITPPWLHFQIVSAPPELSEGAELLYRISLHGLPMRWTTEIERWRPPHEFVDVQKSGPYRVWRHTHRFEARGSATLVSDHVEYALPFGPLGDLFHAFVKKDLAKIFDYRTEQIGKLLRSE